MMLPPSSSFFFFFFFNDTATTEIYTLSLHDALPICGRRRRVRMRRLRPPGGVLRAGANHPARAAGDGHRQGYAADRKSTRLNSSHDQISYAVFCLKKKKTQQEYAHTK